MIQIAQWVHTPFAQALGWTLVHFLWEGAVLAALLMATLYRWRGAPARRRYATACLFLAAMPVAFGATVAVLWSHQPAAMVLPGPSGAHPMTITLVATPPDAAPRLSVPGVLDRLAWLVPLWLAGVAFFWARGILGWLGVQRLRRRGVCAPEPAWQWHVNFLARRMGISRAVTLLESCLVDTPVLLGYLRPVILLPVGCLAGLSTTQVECILVHELAHVLRRDYLINLLQSVVEGLLFYHPAVWWVSRIVRLEREHCCDDRVVEMTGDARSYALTLAAMEQRRAPQTALAATGGSLMKRIRRLTEGPVSPRMSCAPAVTAALLLMLFGAVFTAVPADLSERHSRFPRQLKLSIVPVPQKAVPLQTVATPYQKWVDEEVVYLITPEERAAFGRFTSDQEREAFIEQFWKRRDPTPDTPKNELQEEHYRRIAHANENFGYGKVPGWRSDRGRMYILHGPPDSVRNYASEGRQEWQYRHLEGQGTNVTLEFIDPDHTGEFRLRQNAPNPRPGYAMSDEERTAFLALQLGAKVFYSQEQPRVRVIVNARPAGSAAISPGDRLNISYQEGAADPRIETKAAACRALQDRYTSDFPELRRCFDELRSLQDSAQTVMSGPPAQAIMQLRQQEIDIRARLNASRQNVQNLNRKSEQLQQLLRDAQEKINSSAMVASRYNGLVQQVELAKDVYSRDVAKSVKGAQFQADRAQMEKAQSELSEFVAANQGRLPENLEANRMALSAVNAEIGQNNDRLRQEQQNQALLESSLSNNKIQQAQAEQNIGSANREIHTTGAVDSQGRIIVEGLGAFAAASLTPAQLESSIGHNARVQSVDSTSRTVTVLIPIEGSGTWHILGEVVTPSNRIVSNFEQAASNQTALAKNIFLRPGTYRLKVAMNNVESGTVNTSALDFTVE